MKPSEFAKAGPADEPRDHGRWASGKTSPAPKRVSLTKKDYAQFLVSVLGHSTALSYRRMETPLTEEGEAEDQRLEVQEKALLPTIRKLRALVANPKLPSLTKDDLKQVLDSAVAYDSHLDNRMLDGDDLTVRRLRESQKVPVAVSQKVRALLG